MRRLILMASTALVAACSVQAEEPVAFTGAEIHPVAGDPIEEGVLLLDGDTITEVGAVNEVRVPEDAEVIDVSGKVIIPGLVDTHSHIADVAGGDGADALHPGTRALDAIDVRSDSARRAWAGGITTANVMPGSGHLMSGQTAYVKLRPDARVIDDWLFCDNPTEDVCGGMKMANGTNPIRDSQPFPGTRAKAAEQVRSLFAEAEAYREQREGDDPPSRDLAKEALLQVLDGERTVHHHTHRHDDILTVLRLADEFGYEPVLHHVSEAWKVPEEIAEAGVAASIIMIDTPGGKLEAVNLLWDNAPALEEAGVDTAFHTDDLVTDSRVFLRSAGLGVRAGMSEAGALEALTLAGARMMGLEDRVGSLEPGKDADFVVLDGPPLAAYTRVLETWVEGEQVFDRDDPEQREWATGGTSVFGPGTGAHGHGEQQ